MLQGGEPLVLLFNETTNCMSLDYWSIFSIDAYPLLLDKGCPLRNVSLWVTGSNGRDGYSRPSGSSSHGTVPVHLLNMSFLFP